MKKKEYTGTCYIGTVGAEIGIEECRDSIDSIARRIGDGGIVRHRGTKGYESRQLHFNKFIESQYDFMLLLDADMVFPADTLERLRSHKLPVVSGFYMRRALDPAGPVWYEYPRNGKYPFAPWVYKPDKSKLYAIGASGWGCILIHREVIQAVNKLLKGEPIVIEDDMDIGPYNLGSIMTAIRGMRDLVDSQPGKEVTISALANFTTILENEIVPINYRKDVIYGSDIRFGYYVWKAGYMMMGDPNVAPGHMVNLPLGLGEYQAADDKAIELSRKNSYRAVNEMRRKNDEERERLSR